MSHSKLTNDSNTTRIAILETNISHIHETLERIENNMSIGFANIHNRFEKIDDRFNKIESKVDSNFKWLITLYIGGGLGLLTVLAKGFHWL